MSRALVNTLRLSLRPAKCSPLMLPRTVLSAGQVRWSSHSPLGAAPANARKPITLNTLQSLYRKGEPITMVTAHDFPSAHVADHAGMDMILVGDSLAMVALGMEDTSEVLMEEMLLHCKSVARATKSAFTVLIPSPFLSYPLSFCLAPLLPLPTSILTHFRSATSPWEPTRSRPHKPLPLPSP